MTTTSSFVNSTTRIFYLRNSERHPVACVAIDVDRKNKQVKYAYSSLHAKDSFVKKTGRLIATGRLNKHPVTLSFSDSEINMHGISRLVVQDLVNDSKFTYTAKDAGDEWLERAAEFDSE